MNWEKVDSAAVNCLYTKVNNYQCFCLFPSVTQQCGVAEDEARRYHVVHALLGQCKVPGNERRLRTSRLTWSEHNIIQVYLCSQLHCEKTAICCKGTLKKSSIRRDKASIITRSRMNLIVTDRAKTKGHCTHVIKAVSSTTFTQVFSFFLKIYTLNRSSIVNEGLGKHVKGTHAS